MIKDYKMESVKSLEEFQKKFAEICQKWTHNKDGTEVTKIFDRPEFRLWFRGQADKTYGLKPGVFRNDFIHESDKNKSIPLNQLILLKERHLFKEFKRRSAGLIPSNIDDIDLYFLQQHYGMPTRLLDWSSNLLVALFFAVQKYDEKDGLVFILDSYKLSNNENYGNPSKNNPDLKDSIKIIAEWDDKFKFPKYTFPVSAHYFDSRMLFQRAGFTFHVEQCNDLQCNDLLGHKNKPINQICIEGQSKKIIRNELQLMGIDEFFIYGDLENLSKSLKSLFAGKTLT